MTAQKNWRRVLATATMGLLVASGLALAPAAANAADAPTISGVATAVANERVDIAVTGSGFDDVQMLQGQSEPHVYVKLSEVGADLSKVEQSDTSISLSVVDGGVSGTLPVPVAELDRTKTYELISWPSRSNPTNENLYARAGVTIDWDALFPPAPAVPTISGVATAVANERVDIAVTGSGFDDVQMLQGQSEPHVYVKLSEVGADLSKVEQSDTSISLSVVDGGVSGTLPVPVAELDRTKTYELISWPSRSNPTNENLYARAGVTIDWDALFPAAPEVPATSLDLSVLPAEGSLTIEATVSNPPVNSPGTYLSLIEEGTAGELTQENPGLGATLISASDFVDGVAEASMHIDAKDLDRTKSYEVIAWAHRTLPTAETLYARTALEVSAAQWDIVFPVVYTPKLSVSDASDLDPAGATVTVIGSGYNPKQAIYIFLCSDVELPTNLFDHALNCQKGAKVVYAHGAKTKAGDPQPLQFDAEGNFTTSFDVRALDAAATAVFTAANHTAMADRGQDAKAVLSFAPAKDTSVAVTAQSESVFGDRVQLSAAVTPVNAEGTVTFYADETPLGIPQTLLLGSASVSVDQLSAGTHEITARFTPKNNKIFDASESEVHSLNVKKAPTSIKLNDPAATVFGTEAKFEASVTPGAEGTVEFFAEEQSVGIGTVVDGSASVAVGGLNAGNYNVTAKFTPTADSNFEESVSDGVMLTIEKAKTATELIAPYTVELGTSAAFMAEVSPAASGSVEFFIDDVQIGASIPVVEGTATSEKTPALNNDTHDVRAVFTSADPNYSDSEGSAEIRTVDHDSATAAIKNGEQKIVAGTTVRFEVGEFAVGTDVSGVIDPTRAPEESEDESAPDLAGAAAVSLQAAASGIDLGTELAGANGFAAFKFVVPEGFEGEHTAIFTTASGSEAAVTFVVAAAAVDAAGSGADGSGTDTPADGATGVNDSNAANAAQGAEGAASVGGEHGSSSQLASTGGGDFVGIAIAALLAFVVGAGVIATRRRVNQ
ncbi:Ig-like domain-containing protein [Leucobacter sp. USCH14]|uniref:Ig-like domain-containing protein n=1 Tax=Leucobacter sp. USCH14 TaxID=3024838 RepID=UPI00309FB251